MAAGFFIEKDNSLRLALKGNPSTGYEWDFDQEPADGAFTVTTEYVQDEEPGDGVMPGSGGMYYFTIKAGSEAADGTISLTYFRPVDLSVKLEYEFPIHIA